MNEQTFLPQLKDKAAKAISHLKEELAGIRSGRATPSLIEGFKVEAYGQKMDLRELASITAPEPRLLIVQVWDQANTEAIEKAIRDSNLGLNPAREGNLIRIPIPPLTEERRREMSKLVGERSEAARVAVRQIRREAISEIEKAEKDKEISEDEKFRLTEAVQEIIEEAINEIDLLAKNKESEIMQI